MLILGVLLILFGGYVTLANWVLVYEWYRRKHHSSQIPFIGGLCLALGFFCVYKTEYAFLAALLDPSYVSFFAAIPLIVIHEFQISRFRLLHCFNAKCDHADYTLKLFKYGIFRIQIDFYPPAPCNEHGAAILSDNMQGKWLLENDRYVLTDYRDDRRAILSPFSDSIYALYESNYPESKQYTYDSLNNIQFELVHSKKQDETT